MTTILKCSILSILKLEKLQVDPFNRRVLQKDVQYCLRKDEFTFSPGIKLQQAPPSIKAKPRLPRSSWLLLTAFAILLLAVIVKLTFPYPLHASCLVKWEFREPCAFVIQRLRSQIIKWSNFKYCASRCQYKISEPLSFENNTIRAMRINYRYRVVDDIDIVFIEKTSRSCGALAESTSQNWYNLFDDGRNYCNLRDLIVGAGYDNHYLEFTNDMICTQYEMAHCQ